MKSKLKSHSILLLGLALLLASLVVGCASEPSEPPVSYPVLTAEQVISRVQVYGVPILKIYDKVASPVGQWSAVYEGDGKWRVQGAVVVRYREKDYYSSTTWMYTQIGMQGEIAFIHIDGPPALTQEEWDRMLEYLKSQIK